MSEIRQHGRDLIDAARLEQTPSPADRERVFAALLASAAVSTSAATAFAAPSLLTKLTSGAAKWWLLGGLCGALAGGAYIAARPSAAPRAVPAASPVSASTPAALAVPALPQLLASAQPAPSQPELAPAARAASAKVDSVAGSLELELAALHAAHAAYRTGHAEQALALLSQHKGRFPRSQLAVERATLEVLALCRLGRQAQAQQLASKLRSNAQSSAALSGLEGSCVAAPSK